MIKSNFQLQKEKERSVLDCITSITGKLNEATVVGFSAPMGGIAKPNPSWAEQQVNKLTNPSLPLPLKPGQSTPFVAKPPFLSQAQSSQQTQASKQSQTTRPSPDIIEPSPDERYKETMDTGNFSGASIANTAGMKERASSQVRSAAATSTAPYNPLAWLNNPEESKFWSDQNSGSNKEVEQYQIPADRKAQLKAEYDAQAAREQTEAKIKAKKDAEEAKDKRLEGDITVNDDGVSTRSGGEKNIIHNRLQSQRNAQNAREAERLAGEEKAQENREKARDLNRRKNSHPIYHQKSGVVTDSVTGKKIGQQRGEDDDSNSDSSETTNENFKSLLGRLDEIASGVAGGIGLIGSSDLAKQAKTFAVNAGKESINFAKNYAPKIGYIALTPPRTLAAAATGRMGSGDLGFSKQGAQNTFDYYRGMIGGLGRAGSNLATGLVGTAGGQKLSGVAGKAGGIVDKAINKIPLGRIGVQLGKDVVASMDPEEHLNAAADEAATLTGAALYDPRMAGQNFKSRVVQTNQQNN
jgi:hypothetical protein